MALSTGACDDEATPFLVGRYVDFATVDPAVSLCEGTPARFDRHVERVHEFIGEPVPAGLQVPVRVVDDSICPKAAACYSPADRTIYVENLDLIGWPGSTLEHELTHAVIARVWGYSIPALQEGLASALTSRDWFEGAPGKPVRAMLDLDAEDLDYEELGRFVRYLIDTYGVERFARLYQATYGLTGAALAASFVDVYGEELATIEDSYLSGAPRCRYQLDACSTPEIVAVGTGWSETFAASCLDPDFYGSRTGEYERFATQRTLRIDTAGSYRITTSLPPVLGPDGAPIGSAALLVRCGDCDEQLVRSVFSQSEFNLAAGTYSLLLRPAGESVVTVRVVPLDESP